MTNSPESTTPDSAPITDPDAVLDEGTFSKIREPRGAARLALDGAWHQLARQYVWVRMISTGIVLLIVLAGAAVGGVALGLILFLVTRPVAPSLGSMGTIIATAVCGALLVIAGLVAEQLCTIRKDDDDEQPGVDDTGLSTHH